MQLSLINKSDRCDHTIAHGHEDIYGGFVKESEMPEMSKFIIGKVTAWVNNKPDRPVSSHIRALKKEYEFLSRELTLFDFCPDCGKNIDWSKYKKTDATIINN